MIKLVSNSPNDTERIGEEIGKNLNSKDVICLSGDLGVGKTLLVKGIAKGIDITEHITSPTFTIMNEYNGKYILYHFDVYRVNSEDDLYDIGFEEYVYGDGISIIEWAELVKEALPDDKLWIEICKEPNKDDNYREIIITPYGQRFIKMAQKLDLSRGEENEGFSN